MAVYLYDFFTKLLFFLLLIDITYSQQIITQSNRYSVFTLLPLDAKILFFCGQLAILYLMFDVLYALQVITWADQKEVRCTFLNKTASMCLYIVTCLFILFKCKHCYSHKITHNPRYQGYNGTSEYSVFVM